MSNIHVSQIPQQLAETAAQHFLWLGNEAIQKHGRFSVSLAGGSTPKQTYAILSTPEYAKRINWRLVHIFWGDERCVPPDHPDSNYRMTKESLLDHIPISQGNIHRMRGELEPTKAALEYETNVRHFFEGRPHFDLILLGMGTDGHTASLFPGTDPINEKNRWVVAHYVDKLASWRITLTPAIINQARNINFLVSGESKAQPLQRVLHGQYQPSLLPSQIVSPANGTVTWLLDSAAATRLN
jgi:6-phosphogluconolactonase